MDYQRRVIVSGIIERDGKFLLIRQGDGKHRGLWGFPGGGLELSEPDLETCLRREIREEVGVEIEGERLLDAQAFLDEKHQLQLVAVFFRCRIKSGEPKTTEEAAEFKWLTPDEMRYFPRELIRPPASWFDRVLEKL